MIEESDASRRATAIDGGLAAVLLAIAIATAPFLNSWMPGQRSIDPGGYALLAFACLPLVLRYRFPIGVLAAVTLSVSTYLVLNYPYGPVFLPLAVAVYTVGRNGSNQRVIAASIGAFLALIAHLFVGPSTAGAFGAIPAAAWITVPLTIGVARRLITESHERELKEIERRKLDNERLRLATEVHDIVGHGLAAIRMQADIALHVAAAKPDHARIALEAISSASAAALEELRATLSAISPATDASSNLKAPTPGLDRVEELCQRVRDAGVVVDLTVTGPRRRVPPDVDITAYRIIQESITNVVKHAATRRATVEITYDEASLTLTISSQHDGGFIEEGFGIRGMRRRAEHLGGEFTLVQGDIIRIRATLPTPIA